MLEEPCNLPHGVYLPLWTFDLGGEIDYVGETIDTDDVQFGSKRPKTIRVSDSYPVQVNDLPIPASRKLSAVFLKLIPSFELRGIKPYDPRYLVNWPAEVYDIPMAEASPRSACPGLARYKRELPGRLDPTHILSTSSARMTINSFRLNLLPVWVTEIHFGGRQHLGFNQRAKWIGCQRSARKKTGCKRIDELAGGFAGRVKTYAFSNCPLSIGFSASFLRVTLSPLWLSYSMSSTIPILRARRPRRLARQHLHEDRTRNAFLVAGMFFCLLIAASIITTAFAYINLTRDLPSADCSPLCSTHPMDCSCSQHASMIVRGGESPVHIWDGDSTRRYIPLSDTNPQYLPKFLGDAVIARTDPDFWNHPGYSLAGMTDPEAHPTIAQKLVYDLLLFDEPPTLQRALRERLLAAQITAQYGRTQILEWYLNSANFGRYAFGAEAAAQLYFGKSATQLTTAEAAILAAVSESPSLKSARRTGDGPGTRA